MFPWHMTAATVRPGKVLLEKMLRLTIPVKFSWQQQQHRQKKK
jgi:hypothetical protein